MTASTPDLTKLEAEMREKAQVAQSGVWRASRTSHMTCGGGGVEPRYHLFELEDFAIYPSEGPGPVAIAAGTILAAHIAASCPSNVIALLDWKNAEIARLKASWKKHFDAAQEAEAEVAELRKKLREAEEEGERLTAHLIRYGLPYE